MEKTIIHPLFILIDYRPEFDFVFNQFSIGSCTSNAICLLLYFFMKRQKYNAFIPSRLFLYYNTRCLMGDVDHDTGSYEKEAIQALSEYGVCPESLWPYNVSKFKEMPSEECYRFGRDYPFHTSIQSVLDPSMPLTDILKEISVQLLSGCLWLCTVRRWEEQYIEKETGYLHTPGLLDGDGPRPTMLPFYHSILIVGSDPVKGYLICINSFGTEGGIDDNGSFYIRYEEVPHVIVLENTMAMFGYFRHFEECPSVILESGSTLLSQTPKTVTPVENQNLPAFTTTSFDHVVVGGGMTGAYLVHRLSETFPNDSILLIDQGFFGGEESSVHSSKRMAGDSFAVIESTAYRVNPYVTPKSYALITRYGLPTIPYTEGQLDTDDVDLGLFRRVIRKVGEALGIENPEEMFEDYEWFTSLETKSKIYADPALCSIYFSTWMLENGFTVEEYKVLLSFYMHGTTMHENLPFPVHVYQIFCFYSYILRPDSWVKLTEGILPLKHILLSKFRTVRLGTFIKSAPPQHCFLVDTHAFFDPGRISSMEQSSVLCVGKRLHTVSPNIHIGFKHFYMAVCSPSLSRPLSFTHLVRKPHMKIYLLFSEALPSSILEEYAKRIHHHPFVGRVTFNGDNPSLVTLTLDDFSNRNYVIDLLHKTTNNVVNNVRYDMDSFPYFKQQMNGCLKDIFEISLSPQHFIVYLYDTNECALCTMDVCTEGHSLKEAIDINLGRNSRIHILNVNYGFFYFFLENAFELVDYYFEIDR